MTGSSSTPRGDDDPAHRVQTEGGPTEGVNGDWAFRSTRQISEIQFSRLALSSTTAILYSLVLFVGNVAAQSDVGNTLCGTPIADFINGAAPLVVSLAMLVGAVFAAYLHARSGVARDVEEAQYYMDWRNRAGYTAVTAPLLAFLVQMLIGLTGIGIADCINLVPFF